MRTQESKFFDEKLQLIAENHELQEKLETLSETNRETEEVDGDGRKGGSEDVRVLTGRVSELEDSNAALRRELGQAREKAEDEVDLGGSEELRVLTGRVSELEDSNAALRRELGESRQKAERVRDYEEKRGQLEEATTSIQLLTTEVLDPL